jgi:FtsP/CotA-like multicopper oxidase with cupredoxin domain
MLTRRELIKLGLLSGTYTFLGARKSFADNPPASPPTTPFLADLPLPPSPLEVAPFAAPDCAPFVGQNTRFFQIIEEERLVSFHPQLPRTKVWSYRDINVPAGSFPFAVGPTFTGTLGQGPGGGIVVRHFNDLPAIHQGFGDPHTSVHFHGGHNPARSDGFPTSDFGPGETFDYCYPLRDPGFSTGKPEATERPSTMWYHDHLIDFTGANVYRGLAGFFLAFDDLDTGNETTGLRLPSAPFDIPLVIQDKRFAADGSLVFDALDHNGFLGDKFVVNGAIQPRFGVKRRKYRFRFLNGSNARFYQFVLAKQNGQTFPFDQIATEGGLMAAPIRNLREFRIAPAERVEIVVDFTQFQEGDSVFFENRLQQTDGRKPGDVIPRGPQLLKLTVGNAVDDPSQVPSVLRPFAAISQAELARATVRTIEFDRTDGAWAINGQFFDPNQPLVTARIDTPQIWRLVNGGGGWAHPIHVHQELMRVLRRNGKQPPLQERDGFARRDTVTLGPGESADIFIKFRDFPGPFVFHCHNLEHEDMAMMARFDVSAV